jgi:hypothetical protein
VIDELVRRQQWIEEHKDWIPCRLPHFSIKENAFHLLASQRPLLAATLTLLEIIGAIDGTADITAIVKDPDNVEALTQLWAAGIVTILPPDTAEGGPHIVAIEPHLDDVALSAVGALLPRRDSARKTILSVV